MAAKGLEITAKDMLIIWEAVAEGSNSIEEIESRFGGEYGLGERTPAADTIRKYIGRYQEFLRLLPEYPHVCKALRPVILGRPATAITADERRHFEEICQAIERWRVEIEEIAECPLFIGEGRLPLKLEDDLFFADVQTHFPELMEKYADWKKTLVGLFGQYNSDLLTRPALDEKVAEASVRLTEEMDRMLSRRTFGGRCARCP